MDTGFREVQAKIEGFPYKREKEEYRCPMNRSLPFKGFSFNKNEPVFKNYCVAPRDCKACPMKSSCAPNRKCKNITRTIYDEPYLRAYARHHRKWGKRMKKQRQSKVEPVFGSLTQFYGLRKIGVLGKARAKKVMLMAAISFNLKKYLKNGGRKPLLVFSWPLWMYSKAA